MLTNEEMGVRGRALADQVMAFAVEHERESHKGGICPANRASIIAYFMHCLGLHSGLGMGMWSKLDELLQEYEAVCPNCDHGKVEYEDR